MLPRRRLSDGVDGAATSSRADSPAGSAPRTGRGGKASAPRNGLGGSARASRGRGKGRSTGTDTTAAHTLNGGRTGTASEDEGEDEDAGYSRSPSSSIEGSPRAPSPELGVPAAVHALLRPPLGLPRASSLSLLSDDRSPSPIPPDPASGLPGALDDSQSIFDDGDDTLLASPSSHVTTREVGTPSRPDGSRIEVPSSMLGATPSRTVDDSLSELDTSDDEKRVNPGAGAESSDDESLVSTSALSPAPPHLTPYRSTLDKSQSPAASPVPKRRGRPPGSKNKQPKAPMPRAQRSAAKADQPYRAPSGSEGAASPGAPGGAKQRATRANVTLPPGYIEGVTSSRWPKAGGRIKRDEEADDTDAAFEAAHADDVTGTTTPVESRASSVSVLNGRIGEGGGSGDAEGQAQENALISALERNRKGKGRAVDGEDDDDVSMNGDGTAGISAPMSRETSVEERSVTPAVTATPTKGKGRGRGGKRGRKVQAMSEPIERAKRRKPEIPDKEAEARHFARETARVKFLDQLDLELDRVEDRSHPLLDIAYQRLREEKRERLDRLRRYQDEREKELTLMLDRQIQASWRQWADNKDALRMKLYLENHTSLKELIAEEKIFPFFRDHPLFINNHDLPPTSYYRGPQRDPAFQPRGVLHAGHYVEPPPLNSALKHEAWQLAPEEIEADLALFYDIEDEPLYAPPTATPVPPASAMGPFGYPPHPPFYYDPLASAPGATPYLQPPGYAVPPIPPPSNAPYGLAPYFAPPSAALPPAPGAALTPYGAPPHPFAAHGYPYEPQSHVNGAASLAAGHVPTPPSTSAREPATSAVAPDHHRAASSHVQPTAHAPQLSQPSQAAPLPPAQLKASPTLQKMPPVPAPPTMPKPAHTSNGGSARSPPIPPMQIQRPPSHGSSKAATANGHVHAHPPAHGQSPPLSSRSNQPGPYELQQQHTKSPFVPQNPQTAPQQPPRQHTQHSHPPTFPSSQPASPSAPRPREQPPQPPSYPTAAQRFSPSFGVQTKASSVGSVPSFSPSLPSLGTQAHGQSYGQGQALSQSQSSLPPMRGTLFPSMPTPASAGTPMHSALSPPGGLAPPTLPSLSRRSTPAAVSPPRPHPPSARSPSASLSSAPSPAPGGNTPAPVVERVLPPLWASGSLPGGGVGMRAQPAPSSHLHASQQPPLVGPATGLPLPSWLKPLAQQVKLPHEVRREEEARAAKAAQVQAQAQAQGQGQSGPGAGVGPTAVQQGRPAWAS